MVHDQLVGALEFSGPILCTNAALGSMTEISMGGQIGTLSLPEFPTQKELEAAMPFLPNLQGPGPTRSWCRGKEPIFWGTAGSSSPDGLSSLEKAFVEFPQANSTGLHAQDIYSASCAWIARFEDYLSLQVAHHVRSYRRSCQPLRSFLGLLTNSPTGLCDVPRECRETITVLMLDGSAAMTVASFREAAHFSSLGRPPRLEYSLLLDAYEARERGDFRKAIMIAAVAMEVCVISGIDDHRRGLNTTQRPSTRMPNGLGGKLQLARGMGLDVPTKAQEQPFLELRNEVTHEGARPDRAQAWGFISFAEGLLSKLSPQPNCDEPDEETTCGDSKPQSPCD